MISTNAPLTYKDSPAFMVTALEMLTAFHVNRTQKDHCPWLTVTEGTALGNRLYAYVAAKVSLQKYP